MSGWVVEFEEERWPAVPSVAMQLATRVAELGVAFTRTETEAKNLAALIGGTARPSRVFEIPFEFTHAMPVVAPTAKLLTAWANTATLSWSLSALGVTAANEEGDGIIVGVVDTGVHAAHVDLGCVIATESFVGKQGNEDDIGHGTFAIGVIAGAKQPHHGPRYGIAPKAKVRSYRVYPDALTTDESVVVAGIKKAITDGCRIICFASGVRAAAQVVDDEIADLAQANGALIFAAAGNDSNRAIHDVVATRAPANAGGISAFGAVTAAEALWNRSNGTTTDAARRVDFVAPGDDVVSAFNHNNETILATGTSIATAVACGVAAAVWSRDLTRTPAALLAILRELAKPVAGPAAGIGDGSLRVRT